MKKLLLALSIFSFAGTAKAQWTTVCGSGNGMVVSFAGNDSIMYATGFFTNICGTNAKYIAQWDGNNWTTLDTGLSEAGHRVEVLNNELYVAQYRQEQDSNWVLKWDGSHFQRIGAGVYLTTVNLNTSRVPNLYDVAMYNGKLIASGEFDIVGNRPISGIMQWNGSQWDSLGAGLGGSVTTDSIMYPHQLMVYNGNLYVVGNFATAGGITANGVAMWDGTQWHAMGAGFNGFAYGIGVINNEIYVGGGFTASGSTALHCIAKWNGSNWVDPGFGVYYANQSERPYVHTIQQIGSHGVFEGGFDHAISGGDTSIAHSLLAFDGTNIDTLSGGILNGEFEGLIAHDTDIMVGGALFNTNPETTNISLYSFQHTGVENVSSKQINIYPNPATDNFTIENSSPGSRVNVYGLAGQVVYSGTLNLQSETISVKEWAAGMYLLRITDKNGNALSEKLVKY